MKRNPTDRDVFDVLSLMSFELKGDEAQAFLDDAISEALGDGEYDIHTASTASGSRC